MTKPNDHPYEYKINADGSREVTRVRPPNLVATQHNTHDWVCIEAGNWYSEYECKICKQRRVEQPDE